MVESTAVSCIHPDKYNNSVNRIISKEEERERSKERTSIFFEYSGVFHKYYKNYSVSTRNPVIPCKRNYSTYRINSSTRILQEILQLQGSSRAGSFQQLFPMSPSHSTRQAPAIRLLTAFQGHTVQAGFQ